MNVIAVKLTDVAALAGVSPTTVSRVINNYGSISDKTIAKVKAAMKELNYQPNAMARTLQGKPTKLIGMIMPTIAHPFYGELVEKIEKRLFTKGYRTLLCDCAHDSEKEREYVQMLLANQVDGIIAGAHNLNIEEYQDIKAPVLSFDRRLAKGIPIVGSDNYQGGRLATQLLVDKGCQRIGIFLGTNASDSPTNDRLRGYQDVIEESHLMPFTYPFITDQSPLIKEATISSILATDQLDGVFCTDDLTALLVYNQAKRIGRSIPNELRLIGYDGTTMMRHYFPHLTTVIQPIDVYCEQLVSLLLQMIQGEKISDHYEFPVSIWHGETC